MDKRGWDVLDFLFVSGDAYVDHPSFAAALVGRLLEHHGYRVGIVAQPDWRTEDDFTVMGRPRLGVLVGAGNLDSMLGKLTANKKTRSTDAYSPGGECGLRPDRATLTPTTNRVCHACSIIPRRRRLSIGSTESA